MKLDDIIKATKKAIHYKATKVTVHIDDLECLIVAIETLQYEKSQLLLNKATGLDFYA